MKLGFYIGNVYIDGGLCLGPMAGVSDLAFRKLCKEKDCSLVCTEMVSAKAMLYGNKGCDVLLRTDGTESPLAVQIFGSDPDILTEMALRLEDGPYDIIDFNMGCPVPKVVNNGEGSALMREPKLVEKILSKMCKKLKKPLSIKIRKGFDKQNVNAVEIAKIAEACGVSAIAVHARLREDYYRGEADWSIIKAVKESVSIPVIGNGDIRSGPDAKRMLDETGCDGVMVCRASQGNPWIFKEISEYLKDGSIVERPDLPERIELILRQARMQIENEGEYLAMRQMRKHTAWYSYGIKNASKFREKMNYIENYEELEILLNQLYKSR